MELKIKGPLALRDVEPGIKAPWGFKGSLTLCLFPLLLCKSGSSIFLAEEQFSLLSNPLGSKLLLLTAPVLYLLHLQAQPDWGLTSQFEFQIPQKVTSSGPID